MSAAALIEVKGISKSYGGLQALSSCDLAVAEGSISGLIGPNGSGKTTLFNIITGYEKPNAGEVRFAGQPITNSTPDRVFGLGIGRTFQLTRIFARLTVLENVLVATQRTEGWLRGLLRLAGSASERSHALELLDFVGLRRLASEPAGTLSYGQRKLLELASLLVADPAVLLLDEPAGGVNPTLIKQLGERIRELNRAGKTFLVVEHNMEFVMGICHQVTVLSQGTTLISDRPEVVRADPSVLDAYLGGEGVEDDQSDSPTAAVSRDDERHVGPARATPSVGPAPTVAPAASAPPLLTISGIVAGYGGGDILRDVSFDVAEGGITCIVGPNGAGKSTLLATISGLLRPRLGEIRFEGERLNGLTPGAIVARGISLVPQAHSLFPQMTVAENVEMGAFTIRDRALVAERLAAVIELFPIVRDRAREKAGSLSGGQQRLVEFARCLMLDPKLIILDEPSMGLDPQTRGAVFETVTLMNRLGRTILLVEQNARAGLKLSTQGVVLETGTVRLVGSGREVLEHPEIGSLYLGGSVEDAQPI
ncbi:MAG TPA: ATP-binding cassette domain-containing protein [Solirubrobacteraceae bacterium]|nr:ATP-binding cassette domain-containing protein [Solirubrobacteraceae bacterium]